MSKYVDGPTLRKACAELPGTSGIFMFCWFALKAKGLTEENPVVIDTTADEKRATLSLSLMVSDKKALKMTAAGHEMTIAANIHGWIQEHLEEVGE